MGKKKERPQVFVIILNWNGKEDTRECLDTLFRQDYPFFKALVVDNGSTDGSPVYLKRLFPRVEFILLKRNLGFAKGCNIGIEHALKKKAELILLLNNDTVLAPDMLRKLVNAIKDNPCIGVAGPKSYYHDQRDTIWFAGGRISFFLGNTWHIGNRRKDTGGFEGTIDVDYVSGCAMLLRASLLKKIGGFDPEYHSYFEDCDLCLRARREGFRVVCVRDSKMWHKVSASTGGGLTPLKAYHKITNGARFFKSYAHPLLFRSTIPFFSLFYVLLLTGWKTFRGEFAFCREVYRGYCEILRR